jgi:hypothetical protein
MDNHFDPEDIEKLFGRPRKASRASASDRRTAERKSFVSPNDGRRLRARGPTVQWNVTIRAETKEEISRLARVYGLSYVEIAERAVALLAKELERGAD